MDIVQEILQRSANDAEKYKPITVEKHLDLEYDLGHLLAIDNNDLDEKQLSKYKNEYLKNLTRDNVQLLANKIWELPTERVDEVVVVKLPKPTYILPRAQHVPKPKPLTKWQEFAKSKGIDKTKKSKLKWDEQLQKWIPLYGFKSAAAQNEKDWLIEVPGNADPLEDQFAKKAEKKSEKIAKNELQRLRNVAKAKKIKVPRFGLTTPDASSAKELQTAITVARSSTASLGKFQSKLPKEKEAKGVAVITPGATRKRRLAPVSGKQEKSENLAIVDSILNKRPKLDVEKAVARHINKEEVSRSEEKNTKKPNAGAKGGKKRSMGKGRIVKKPSGAKAARKGKAGSGRKRR